MLSPGRTRPFRSAQSSGRWFFGSHWPRASRSEKIRSLALERSWLAQAEQRARVLEESDRLKSALLSSVSHELRTPLATIKAAATSLRSGEIAWDSAARRDLLGAIDDEADHLNRLVGNLLDLSRLQADAAQPQRELRALDGLVVQALAGLAGHERVEVSIPGDLPLVDLDAAQIERALVNLIEIETGEQVTAVVATWIESAKPSLTTSVTG